MEFSSFKKLNSEQYLRRGKNDFSESIGGGMVSTSSMSALDLVPAGCRLFEVGFGWKYYHSYKLLWVVTGAS